MGGSTGGSRFTARSEILPVGLVALLGAVLLAVALLWDGGLPDSAVDPTSGAAAIGQVAEGVRDQTAPRHDRAEVQADGELLVESLAVEARAAQAAAAAPDQQLRAAAESGVTKVREVSFRVASFNVLASQHTDAGGDRPNWPSSGWRTPQAVGYIQRHGAAVVGLQEVKSGQLAGLTAGTGFRAWPGGGDPDNSIIYDPDVFEFVSGDTFSITFMNSVRPQTILRLRHRATRLEFYFVNMHASAGGGKYAASRAAGHNTLVGVVNRLKSEGIPVFVTGDMNDREVFFCRVLPPTGMVAAVGGSTAGGCRPPGGMPVDWVTATSGVAFSGFVNDKSTVARRVSDHHFVVATATVKGVA